MPEEAKAEIKFIPITTPFWVGGKERQLRDSFLQKTSQIDTSFGCRRGRKKKEEEKGAA